MKWIIFALLFLFPVCAAQAADVTGTGCADDKHTAKKYALDDLSSQIRVHVESELYMSTRRQGAEPVSFISHKICLTTALDINEYSINYTERNGSFCASVFIPREKLPLYQSKAASIVKEINTYTDRADKVKLDSQRADLLHKALGKYSELDDTAVVVRFLGAVPPFPAKERAETEMELIRMQRVSSDITQIAKNIMSRFNGKNVYVNPVQLYDSVAIPPFAAMLTQQMRLSGAKNKDAPYHLYCQYTPEGDPFTISCELRSGGIIKDTFVTAAGAEVCRQTNCDSSASMKRMEQIFGSYGGELFRGYFYTNYGDSGVMLREGDVLTLYARLSEAASVAVLHHDGVKTRIFPLSETSPTINISEKLINRETELIKLKVTPPFGTDTLIFIAYKGDLCDLLPCEDDKSIPEIFNAEELSVKLSKLPAGKYIKRLIVFNTEPAK